MRRKQTKVVTKVATIYVSPLLQRGTVRVMGMEVDPTLPPGCIGVMFAFDTREGAVTDSGGRDPICMERAYYEPVTAKPVKRRRKAGA